MVKKDPHTGLWYYRTRVTNPFSGESFRKKDTPPRAINSKKTAEEWERAFIAEATKDPATVQAVPKAATTVKEVAAGYVEKMKSRRDIAESYVISIETKLEHHILPALGEKVMSSITEDDLEEFKIKLENTVCSVNGKTAQKRREARERGEIPDDDLPSQVRSGKLLSARMVGSVLRVLHAMFVFARAKKHVPEIPIFPAPPAAVKKKPVYLTFEEADAVVSAAENDDERLALLFAIETGVRVSEQSAFLWEEVQWSPGNEHIMIVRAHKLSKKVRNKVGAPKGKAERTVPISAVLLSALQEARKRLFGDKRPTGLMFTRAGSKERMTVNHFRPILRRALKKVGVTKHVRWHDLRHTFGSHKAMQKVSLYQIQDWMGHASFSTTEIYAHLCPRNGVAAMRDADRVRREIQGGQLAAKPASITQPAGPN